MTRVGVIGMGRWGRQLIRVFAQEAEVVVCANRGDAASIRWLAETYPHARHTTKVEALLGDAEIEAVVIATPIATHAELATAALEARKHVFVEKPLGTSIEDCDSAIRASNRARRELFVGYTFLYDGGLEQLHVRTRMDPVESMKMVWRKLGTFQEPLAWNLLTHEVAIALWLIGGLPTNIHIVEAQPLQASLDRLHVIFEFPEDRRSSIEIDRSSSLREKTIEATTVSGTRYRWSQGVLATLDADRAWRTTHVASTDALTREVRAFLAWIVAGKPPASDASFSRRVTSVVADVERRWKGSSDAGSSGIAPP